MGKNKANLSSFSTIDITVKKYKDDYNLPSVGSAFVWLGLQTILNLNEDEVEETKTDGSNDQGIDAIYIDGRTIHILTFKYATTFINSKRNFPETDLNTLAGTIQGIYEKEILQKSVNTALWEHIKEIWNLFNSGPLDFKIYICTNKQKPTSTVIKSFEKKLNKYRAIEYIYVDQEDFVSRIVEKKQKKINGKLQFTDKQYFERSDGNLKGIVATVSATELINLISDSENEGLLFEDIFNENVRIYLKLRNRINRNIYDASLSDDNYEFWYLNNGITIVCEQCNYTPNSQSPVAELENLQIVNGGQTTHALFEAYQNDPQKISNVLVLVRIYETRKNHTISEKISETTNSQTPIRTRDLHANDRIQKKLEEQFLSLGYYYERKKKSTFHST